MTIKIVRTNTRRFIVYRCYWFFKKPIAETYSSNLDTWVPTTYRTLEEAQLAVWHYLNNVVFVKPFEDTVQIIKL